MKKVLIIEDDVNLGTPLAGALEMHDYKVSYLANCNKAMEEFNCFQPDIVLLDIILNGELDGFEIGNQIRKINDVPIVFTTSCDGNEDFKQAFSIANTDYVRKPYRLIEILLRIERLLSSEQKQTHKSEKCYQIGQFNFFPEEQMINFEHEKIHLTNYESAVFTILCQNRDTFVTRKSIIETVWHEKESKLKEGSLNNIVTTLRKYLSKDNRITLESKIKLGIKLTLSQ